MFEKETKFDDEASQSESPSSAALAKERAEDDEHKNEKHMAPRGLKKLRKRAREILHNNRVRFNQFKQNLSHKKKLIKRIVLNSFHSKGSYSTGSYARLTHNTDNSEAPNHEHDNSLDGENLPSGNAYKRKRDEATDESFVSPIRNSSILNTNLSAKVSPSSKKRCVTLARRPGVSGVSKTAKANSRGDNENCLLNYKKYKLKRSDSLNLIRNENEMIDELFTTSARIDDHHGDHVRSATNSHDDSLNAFNHSDQLSVASNDNYSQSNSTDSFYLNSNILSFNSNSSNDNQQTVTAQSASHQHLINSNSYLNNASFNCSVDSVPSTENHSSSESCASVSRNVASKSPCKQLLIKHKKVKIIEESESDSESEDDVIDEEDGGDSSAEFESEEDDEVEEDDEEEEYDEEDEDESHVSAVQVESHYASQQHYQSHLYSSYHHYQYHDCAQSSDHSSYAANTNERTSDTYLEYTNTCASPSSTPSSSSAPNSSIVSLPILNGAPCDNMVTNNDQQSHQSFGNSNEYSINNSNGQSQGYYMVSETKPESSNQRGAYYSSMSTKMEQINQKLKHDLLKMSYDKFKQFRQNEKLLRQTVLIRNAIKLLQIEMQQQQQHQHHQSQIQQHQHQFHQQQQQMHMQPNYSSYGHSNANGYVVHTDAHGTNNSQLSDDRAHFAFSKNIFFDNELCDEISVDEERPPLLASMLSSSVNANHNSYYANHMTAQSQSHFNNASYDSTLYTASSTSAPSSIGSSLNCNDNVDGITSDINQTNNTTDGTAAYCFGSAGASYSPVEESIKCSDGSESENDGTAKEGSESKGATNEATESKDTLHVQKNPSFDFMHIYCSNASTCDDANASPANCSYKYAFMLQTFNGHAPIDLFQTDTHAVATVQSEIGRECVESDTTNLMFASSHHMSVPTVSNVAATSPVPPLDSNGPSSPTSTNHCAVLVQAR